ncbi:MAG: metallophosphoesterase family protein [Candidatus Omnitrophica bacterium]|nr:metallophosphoesterase family protein [Candidatus Omnitrophota bacterium]
MVKIGVISDTHLTHYEDLPLKVQLALTEVDLILHAGDLNSLNVLEGLNKIGPEVHAVCGNMDPPEVKRALPERKIIKTGQFSIGLIHGRGAPVNLIKTVQEQFADEHLDCVVYGHSHSPHNQIHQGLLFFNPGSPTDRFFAPYNSYGILEIGKKITGKIIKF